MIYIMHHVTQKNKPQMIFTVPRITSAKDITTLAPYLSAVGVEHTSIWKIKCKMTSRKKVSKSDLTKKEWRIRVSSVLTVCLWPCPCRMLYGGEPCGDGSLLRSYDDEPTGVSDRSGEPAAPDHGRHRAQLPGVPGPAGHQDRRLLKGGDIGWAGLSTLTPWLSVRHQSSSSLMKAVLRILCPLKSVIMRFWFIVLTFGIFLNFLLLFSPHFCSMAANHQVRSTSIYCAQY